MPRLFIAIDTPAELADELLRILPAHHDIRPTPAAQLHLTLRFLGERDELAAAGIAGALRSVLMPSLALQVHGVGRFRGRQGAILWAGLAASPALVALSDAINTVLEAEGIAPEHRRFWPHLTLARCRPGTPEPLLRDWLAAFHGLTLPSWNIAGFVLYESFLGREGARHVARDTYRLVTPDC